MEALTKNEPTTGHVHGLEVLTIFTLGGHATSLGPAQVLDPSGFHEGVTRTKSAPKGGAPSWKPICAVGSADAASDILVNFSVWIPVGLYFNEPASGRHCE